MKVWHVYIESDEKEQLPLYPRSSKLPFDDNFSNMKLFSTKKSAIKYIDGELKRIGKYLAYLGDVEGKAYEAVDGGELRRGVVVYERRLGVAGIADKAVRSVWFKAVSRKVYK